MRTLILGADGQLGTELMKIFPDSVGSPHSGSRKLDIQDFAAVSGLLFEESPELIINASALTNVDLCEEEKTTAIRTNGYAVGNIVECARELNSYFIHVSTDYVFDGLIGNYNENSTPNPVNYYGLSKLIGDVFAQSYRKSLIIRTSGVFGRANNFPRFSYNALKYGKGLNVIEGYYSPIHARLLAESI